MCVGDGKGGVRRGRICTAHHRCQPIEIMTFLGGEVDQAHFAANKQNLQMQPPECLERGVDRSAAICFVPRYGCAGCLKGDDALRLTATTGARLLDPVVHGPTSQYFGAAGRGQPPSFGAGCSRGNRVILLGLSEGYFVVYNRSLENKSKF